LHVTIRSCPLKLVSTERSRLAVDALHRMVPFNEAESSSDVLRERMIAELIETGVLTDPGIEAAFRAARGRCSRQPALRLSCRTRSTTPYGRGSRTRAGPCPRCPHQ
jgi:hypothetical protein